MKYKSPSLILAALACTLILHTPAALAKAEIVMSIDEGKKLPVIAVQDSTGVASEKNHAKFGKGHAEPIHVIRPCDADNYKFIDAQTKAPLERQKQPRKLAIGWFEEGKAMLEIVITRPVLTAFERQEKKDDCKLSFSYEQIEFMDAKNGKALDEDWIGK